jgi:hypothetical protein
MPPAAPAAQNPNIGVAPKNQPAVGASLNNERLAGRAAETAGGAGADGDGQPNPAEQASPQAEMPPEDTEPDEIQTQMDQERFLKINTQRTAQQQEKAQQFAQGVTATLGKNPWGRALLLGIKYILKIVALFGPNCVGFVVTAWVIGIPLNMMFFWIPIFGVFIAGFFSVIFAIPMQSFIYPKLKPYVDEIIKQTSLIPKASQVKGGTKLPGR